MDRKQKTTLIKDTYETIGTLYLEIRKAYDRVKEKYPKIVEKSDGYLHTLLIPLGRVHTGLENIVHIVDDREVGKEYSILHPLKMARAQRATRAAEKLLNMLPEKQMENIKKYGQAVLNGNLEESIIHYYGCADSKGIDNMQPVRDIMNVLLYSQGGPRNSEKHPDRVAGRGHVLDALVSVSTGCAAVVGYLKAVDMYVTTLQTELLKAPDFTSQVYRAAKETAVRAASGDFYMSIFFSLISAVAICKYVENRKLN